MTFTNVTDEALLEFEALMQRALDQFRRLTPEQQAEHMRRQMLSFVYGNCHLDNPNVTRDHVAATDAESCGRPSCCDCKVAP